MPFQSGAIIATTLFPTFITEDLGLPVAFTELGDRRPPPMGFRKLDAGLFDRLISRCDSRSGLLRAPTGGGRDLCVWWGGGGLHWEWGARRV